MKCGKICQAPGASAPGARRNTMILSGWFKIGVTAILCLTLIIIVVHYYRPGRKEDAEKVESPKYRMLDDDDEK